MNARLIERVWVGAVVLCCLAVGIAGGAVSEGARTTIVETEPAIESRAESTEKQRHTDQLQVANANTSGVDNRIRIDVAANGSAAWTIQYRIRLDDANETAAFDTLRTEISVNRTGYTDRFSQRLTDTVSNAEVSTGREMAIENVRVNASQNDDIGTVTYTFDWRNFAATNSDGLQVGDALTGFFLDDGTRLTITWPDAYEATTIRPSPDERQPTEITWNAQTGFDGNEPIVELTRTDTDAGGSNVGDGSGGNGSPEDDVPIAGLVIGGLLLLAGAIAIAWLRQRRRDGATGSFTDGPKPGSDVKMNDGGTATTNVPAGTRNDDGEASVEVSQVDGELLSNEERVIETLRQLGGRAKQQQVVRELGWTDARTSQVVSGLRDEGLVEGFRLGRENVLILPEETDDESDTQ